MRYSIFILDADGGPDAPVRVNRKSDRQAMNAATAMLALGELADVWARDRLVGRVSTPSRPTGGEHDQAERRERLLADRDLPLPS